MNMCANRHVVKCSEGLQYVIQLVVYIYIVYIYVYLYIYIHNIFIYIYIYYSEHVCVC